MFFAVQAARLLARPSCYAFKTAKTHIITRKMSTQPLNWAAGPLVWIDCEMTGLNPRTDKILEIAVISTLQCDGFCNLYLRTL